MTPPGESGSPRPGHPPGLPFRHPAVWLATAFGIGFLPLGPGTWASLATLPVAWLIGAAGGPAALVAAASIVFLVGCWAGGVFAAARGVKDPGAVVIDEVAGQLLTLAVAPPRLFPYAVGFLLFRLADIVKPWPASWADQRLAGGLGIMLDDAFAAIYAGAVLFLLLRFGLV